MKIIGPDGRFSGPEPSALALGHFDGVHIGHMAVIRRALQAPGPTVVVTFPETAVRMLKGSDARALMSDALREQVLASMGVDAVLYLDFSAVRDMGPEGFVRDILIGRLHAGTVSCGFNYSFGRGGAAGPQEMERLCARRGVRAFTVAPVCLNEEPVSSTRIRRLVEQGDMERAAALLGRPFALRLRVVHGRRLGRELGMPTINQPLAENIVAPRFGVYVTAVRLDGVAYTAVTDVGCKPTVGSDRPLAETYILGYSGDLYDQMVTVELLHFLRPEEKFDSIEALSRQMQADADQAARYGARRQPGIIFSADHRAEDAASPTL